MLPAGQARPAYLLYHTMWRSLDWLFPPTCGGCETLGIRWCEACSSKVARIAGPICQQCGDPLPPGQTGLCSDCQSSPPAYVALRSYGIFQGTLREAMHRLKYQRDIGLGEALSKHLIELYNDVNWGIDFVTPVPLSSKRIRERGYNQASLLGRPLAYAIGRPYRPGLLKRTRETRSQVGLSARERQQNVDGAFQANADLVKRKIILIVDDVTTTGSTINACAQAFHQAGASAVYGLTLARAAAHAGAILPTDADSSLNPSHTKRR